MHPIATFQFERIVGEYARWRDVTEEERSPAPAWWWSPALALREETAPMPTEMARTLGLPAGSYADGARIFLAEIAGQTSQPWPDEFPEKFKRETPEPETSEA